MHLFVLCYLACVCSWSSYFIRFKLVSISFTLHFREYVLQCDALHWLSKEYTHRTAAKFYEVVNCSLESGFALFWSVYRKSVGRCTVFTTDNWRNFSCRKCRCRPNEKMLRWIFCAFFIGFLSTSWILIRFECSFGYGILSHWMA